MANSTLNIEIEKAVKSRLSETDFSNLEFGAVYADHMFVTDYQKENWGTSKIIPFQKVTMSPAASVLHYGQTVFEGMKAYKAENGDVLIFRPEAHFLRMNASCRRLCMPEIPKDVFMEGLEKLVKLDRNWIPAQDGCSLYLRPFVYATDEFIGVRPSGSYKFIIFTCPVSGYYKGTVKVIIETEYVRAADGGIGFAKTGGNYAASLLPAKLAAAKGYQQLLWTDAKEHKYFEESGTMNVMFVVNDTILTPPLGSSILAGVTRDSILTLAKDWGVKVEERRVSVEEIVQAMKDRKLQDAFGTGTAATITHISTIHHDGTDYELPAVNTRKLSNKLNDELMKIKLGKAPDKFGWVHRVK